jgi:hypothetical protein
MPAGNRYLTSIENDPCYIENYYEQSSGPMHYRLDPNPFHHCGRCQTQLPTTENPGVLVDIDSVLTNRYLINTKCPSYKYPFCKGGNCIRPNDRSRPPHITPWACEYDITPTNNKRWKYPGFNSGPVNSCDKQLPPASVSSSFEGNQVRRR